MAKKKNTPPMQWRTIDLHIHTPASGDYQQPEVGYLEILQRAEARGLDIIALTDHNTVSGYRRMQEEIHQLELLERLNRLMPGEKERLIQYRRLLDRVLVLPGFEVTATFGFHILAIFSPDKPVRDIEHLLINLNIPTDQLDDGSATVGATTDVLTVYRLIAEAGGLVIAAHANSSNGVAMRGFPIGGQTKIAYTQDPNLHALEVTDLEQKGPRTTAAFFSGTKPEYPRRMHCIQGSDSHRLVGEAQRKKNPGIGDRATDVFLPEVCFAALLDLFQSNDYARTRPHRHKEEPAYDFIRAAREEGANLVQDFHESMAVSGGKLYTILADACAFANTNGGTLYIGLNSDVRKPVTGVSNPESSATQLENEISKRISPSLSCTADIHEVSGKKVLRVLVPRGEDPPYALDDNKIYVRDEAETGLAVRDEIVGLVLRSERGRGTSVKSPVPVPDQASTPTEELPSVEPGAVSPPRTGVEVVEVEEKEGAPYYTLRDLRNGNVVKNVTRISARRLWHYAITQYAKLPADPAGLKIQWHGDMALMRKHKLGNSLRYDFLQRAPQGLRYYFGVTDDGIHGRWKELIGADDE